MQSNTAQAATRSVLDEAGRDGVGCPRREQIIQAVSRDERRRQWLREQLARTPEGATDPRQLALLTGLLNQTGSIQTRAA